MSGGWSVWVDPPREVGLWERVVGNVANRRRWPLSSGPSWYVLLGALHALDEVQS